MNNHLLLGTALALAGEAFFSGTEIALLNANPAQVYRRARRGDWRAARLRTYYAAPEYWLATTLLGTNLCVVAGSFCAETWASQGPRWLPAVTGACLVLAVLLFGETVPKVLIRPRATRWALSATPVLFPLRIVATPLGGFLRLLTWALRRDAALRRPPSGHWASREDLVRLITRRLEGAESLRGLADGAVRQFPRPVGDVMEPLSQLTALPFPSSPKVWRDRLTRHRGGALRLVGRDGRLLAVAEPAGLVGIAPGGPEPPAWPTAPVRVQQRESLAAALGRMASAPAGWALVESGGSPVGTLSLEDLAARFAE